MQTIDAIQRPTKVEQRAAKDSYARLATALSQINGEETEIEIEETQDKIVLPARALKLLGEILKAMSEGKTISVAPVATEVTTQKAAEILGCSRPYLVKLLEDGDIAFVKVGKHRRIQLEDVLQYKQKMKEQQKKYLIHLMNEDEEDGLYDS